jgi:hypothetical protein
VLRRLSAVAGAERVYEGRSMSLIEGIRMRVARVREDADLGDPISLGGVGWRRCYPAGRSGRTPLGRIALLCTSIRSAGRWVVGCPESSSLISLSSGDASYTNEALFHHIFRIDLPSSEWNCAIVQGIIPNPAILPSPSACPRLSKNSICILTHIPKYCLPLAR